MNLDADELLEAAAIVTELKAAPIAVDVVHGEDGSWMDMLLCGPTGGSAVISFSRDGRNHMRIETYVHPSRNEGGPSSTAGREGVDRAIRLLMKRPQ